ncbi:hypothetical protein L226DRAFT_616928 [Lentinus tigrinus ALCF2SS1-7]|uniref:uncharacterized protein n=1 Tax=Lentinus tigrinus ALCF2SS1-7 TaxID=1328758 RepID=UPI001165D8D5|nr:hypothetical protein L226DRAFT_616928 [Lentinus tigrinus ALCF2SS1-7]
MTGCVHHGTRRWSHHARKKTRRGTFPFHKRHRCDSTTLTCARLTQRGCQPVSRALFATLGPSKEEQLQRPITPDYTTKILSRRLEHASIPSHWPLATPTISLAHTRRLFRSPLPATQHDKPAERCAHVVVHDGAQAELYVRDYLIRIGPIPTNGPSGFEDELGSNAIQQKISKTSIENENNALLKYHPNLQGGSSTERLSAVGKPRGYVIYPGHSPIDNTVFDFKRLWNMHAPDDPVINFYKFFDSKNITQADLVAWVNVSVYHLPQNEDPSNTRTKLTVSSFFLMPLNLDFYDVRRCVWRTTPMVSHTRTASATIPPLENVGVKTFGLDGKLIRPTTAKESAEVDL